jgi:glutathione S-transferase
MKIGEDELIVHHHYTSYFSEKARVVLGIKGLAWHSVIEPLIAPRPLYTKLSGGYQRVPSLQIGADLYCDSRLVMAELERRAPEPSVGGGMDFAINAWVDRYFTPATFAVGIGEIADRMGPEFLRDRQELYGPAFDLEGLKAAAAPMSGQWRAQAAWLEDALRAGSGDFLTGSTPTIADAAAFIPFWLFDHRDFLAAAMEVPHEPNDTPVVPLTDRDPEDPLEALLDGLDRVKDWRRRIAAIGHGRPAPITAEDALETAAASQPAPLPPHDPADPLALDPGTPVTVIADDSARDPIPGTLMAVTTEQVVLARNEPMLGTVHVHLPRDGYFVQATAA